MFVTRMNIHCPFGYTRIRLNLVMSEPSVIKVLFVCYGNTCRSPMAESVFKDLATEQNVASRFEIDSAGISEKQKFISRMQQFVVLFSPYRLVAGRTRPK